MNTAKTYLTKPVEHLDITQFNVVPLVESMGRTAYTARDLARAPPRESHLPRPCRR